MAPALFILAGLCAVINWVGLARRNRALERVFKPAAQGAILAGAWIATGGPHMSWLAAFFLPALALSLVGDVLLMLGERWFRAGLAAFLLAHVGLSWG